MAVRPKNDTAELACDEYCTTDSDVNLTRYDNNYFHVLFDIYKVLRIKILRKIQRKYSTSILPALHVPVYLAFLDTLRYRVDSMIFAGFIIRLK